LDLNRLEPWQQDAISAARGPIALQEWEYAGRKDEIEARDSGADYQLFITC
jgi:hypothetical protein